MDVLVKLLKAYSINFIEKLGKKIHSLEISVPNLSALGVETTSYGTLMISIIFDYISREFRNYHVLKI